MLSPSLFSYSPTDAEPILSGREGGRYLKKARVENYRGLSALNNPGQKNRDTGVFLLLVCEWVGGSLVVKSQGLKITQNSPV